MPNINTETLSNALSDIKNDSIINTNIREIKTIKNNVLQITITKK